MRVDELVSSLLRRPLALLMIVALAGAGAYVGWTRATTTYQSSATVLVVPATQTNPQVGTSNPFEQLDYNIANLALVVSRQLGSDAVRDQVVAVGGDGAYTADTLSSDNSAVAQLTPMIGLSATSATAEGAQAAVTALVQQAGAQLASVQTASGVPVASQAKVVTSAAPGAGAPTGSPKLRAAGVLGIAAGIAGLLLAVITTPLFGRRSGGSAGQVREATPTPRPAPAGNGLDGRRRREAMIRQMVRDEWERSGSNVAWTKAQQRAAFDRATRRLDEIEGGIDAEPAAETPDNVWRLDEFTGRRNG